MADLQFDENLGGRFRTNRTESHARYIKTDAAVVLCWVLSMLVGL
jgi:phosphoheptose isomerase